jgi:archaellum biogenesis protein FlaJ (TadC family)
MGNKLSFQNLSCTGISSTLILSVTFGIIGIALIESLIGIPIGLIFLLVSLILFIIGLMSLIVFLVRNRGKDGSFGKKLKDTFTKLSPWCAFCIILSIGLIIGEIVVTAKQFENKPANPVPSNEATTAPG